MINSNRISERVTSHKLLTALLYIKYCIMNKQTRKTTVKPYNKLAGK